MMGKELWVFITVAVCALMIYWAWDGSTLRWAIALLIVLVLLTVMGKRI